MLFHKGDLVRVVDGELFWRDSIGKWQGEYESRPEGVYWKIAFAHGQVGWLRLTDVIRA
jgi:hypothetical protein